MKRREFIAAIGGAVATWPLAAPAQQSTMPVIGYLNSGSSATAAQNTDAFRLGLKDAGYVEHQNVTIEYRWADGQYERLPALAAELVRREVAAIFVSGAGGVSVQAAKAQTSTIPIVFVGGIDPVQLGVVASLNRPGGNVTGVSFLANAIEAKRLGLLRELMPQATALALLVNPANASSEVQLRDAHDAAQKLGVKLLVGKASTDQEFDAALTTFVGDGANGVLVAADAFFLNRRETLVAAVARRSLPAIYQDREIAVAGGLMSYGASIADAFHAAAVYVGRVLKGEKPAEIPVLQSAKFEFVINLRSVKALGLTVPPGLLSIADEVIE